MFFLTFGECPHQFLRSAAGLVLCSVENAEAQKIEAGTAVHGTYDELEAVDVAFDRSVAPWLLKSCEEGGFVVA